MYDSLNKNYLKKTYWLSKNVKHKFNVQNYTEIVE